MAQKTKETRDKVYVGWVTSLPCLLCGKPSEPHHVPKKGNSAKGLKCSDHRAINLCHEHHMKYHNQGRETFAKKYDIMYDHVIMRLRTIYLNREDIYKDE